MFQSFSPSLPIQQISPVSSTRFLPPVISDKWPPIGRPFCVFSCHICYSKKYVYPVLFPTYKIGTNWTQISALNYKMSYRTESPLTYPIFFAILNATSGVILFIPHLFCPCFITTTSPSLFHSSTGNRTGQLKKPPGPAAVYSVIMIKALLTPPCRVRSAFF